MKVVIDDKIPYIKEAIEKMSQEVIFLPGKNITADVIHDADALIVRTRTRLDRSVLENSRVKFIATATIGFDHIDTSYCQEKGIAWTNCPGCNAGSVAQYIHSALLILQEECGVSLRKSRIGIVGVGHVGSRIKELCESLNMEVLCSDPPRTALGEKGFYPLNTLAKECDIITFHTPLTYTGNWPTFHLANEDFFTSLSHPITLINTSRGETVDEKALKNAIYKGIVKHAIIDVWENEPDIDRELLHQTLLGTPHIAGYSADGKANATRMVLQSFCRFFHLPEDFTIVPPSLPFTIEETNPRKKQLRLYDPRHDSSALKNNPEKFEELRGNYPLRREFI